jgi:hypothetical protein
MPPTIRRRIYLDQGRVQIDLPRLMTDDKLAEVLEVFVRDVKGRGSKEPADKPPEPPSTVATNPEDDKKPEVTAVTSTRASAPWWPQGSQRCGMCGGASALAI